MEEEFNIDYNDGLHIQFLNKNKKYHVIIDDALLNCYWYNGIIDTTEEENYNLFTNKKYFVKWHFIILNPETDEILLEDTYNAENKNVLIQCDGEAIGDIIGWFPYAEKFQEQHKCNLYVTLAPKFFEIFKDEYPSLHLISTEESEEIEFYATYKMGLFFHGDKDYQPCDFRFVGNCRTAGYILGLDTSVDPKPRFNLSAKRKIKEPYVCISVQASGYCKRWLNPIGWKDVVKYLKDLGYRVLCIDGDDIVFSDNHCFSIPHDAEDFTGYFPLQERIDLLKDADFFIGTSSGLSWLAWGCNIPVVLISGFTHPTNEFYTPYRIINYQACNSCWNDINIDFDHDDYLWCPRHKGTDREYECSKSIGSGAVIQKIDQLRRDFNYSLQN